MSRLPRILPLVAVAIGGVMAINLLAGAGSLPAMFQGARAWAEDAVAPKAKAKAAPTPAPTPKAASPLPPPIVPVAAGPAPMCAPTTQELANQSGLSPATLQVLQSLGDRRGQLDAREQTLDVQMQLVTAASQKLDAKSAEMQNLIVQLKALLGQADQQAQAENARLVTVYEKMNAPAAAQQLAIMSDDVRLPILAHVKPTALALILRAMSPAQAKEVAEKLAHRTADAVPLDQAKAAVAAATATAPTPAPTQTAAAAPPPAAGAKAAVPAATPATSPTKAGPQAAAAPAKAGSPAAPAAPTAKAAPAPTKAAAAAPAPTKAAAATPAPAAPTTPAAPAAAKSG